MSEDDVITYNLFNVIRSDSASFIVTDDKYYIYAQNSRRAPHWLFIKEQPDDAAFEEIVALIAGMMKLNPLLQINGTPEFVKPILNAVSERYGKTYVTELEMNVYACHELSTIEHVGKMISPSEKHRQILTEYVTEMANDRTGYFMPTDDVEKFVSLLLGSPTLFLWENERIVSMAQIVHKTDKFARINTVFTDAASRGHGYTRMLIGELTKMLMDEGLTPVIYADVTDEEVITPTPI
jgi:predicted GNAT family acetyltransferase